MFGYDKPADISNISVSLLFVRPEQWREVIGAALQSNTYVQKEVQFRRKAGSVFSANLWMRAVRKKSDGASCFEGFVEDLTERKRLEEQLCRAQKLEAVAMLAGGVAHDFNNILSAVLMHLELFRQDPPLPNKTKEFIQELEKEATRAISLTRQLLLFSRREGMHVRAFDINALINNLLKMLRRLLGENVEISFRGCAVPAWIEADEGLVEQVVMNLCINARDAMPKGGRLSLATKLVELHQKRSRKNPEARAGRFVCLSVCDTGCGMDEDVLKHIFEPLFTTKLAGKGTGLGLATVYRIIKKHSGWIEVESAVGKGSLFRIYFPVSSNQPRKTKNNPPESKGGSETILLVEDERSLLRTTGLCLRKLGYAVLEASTADEALKLWRKHQKSIHLMLTDLILPGQTTGVELAESFRKDKPGLSVVVSSGYHSKLVQRPDDDIIYLTKPYDAGTLARTVRRCLDTNVSL